MVEFRIALHEWRFKLKFDTKLSTKLYQTLCFRRLAQGTLLTAGLQSECFSSIRVSNWSKSIRWQASTWQVMPCKARVAVFSEESQPYFHPSYLSRRRWWNFEVLFSKLKQLKFVKMTSSTAIKFHWIMSAVRLFCIMIWNFVQCVNAPPLGSSSDCRRSFASSSLLKTWSRRQAGTCGDVVNSFEVLVLGLS